VHGRCPALNAFICMELSPHRRSISHACMQCMHTLIQYASTHVMPANVLSGITGSPLTASEPSPPFAMPMPPGHRANTKLGRADRYYWAVDWNTGSIGCRRRKAPAAHRPVALRSCHAVARMIQTGPETPTVLVDPRTCR
jgi:hypothetical protein